jgi:hypothetical protein
MIGLEGLLLRLQGKSVRLYFDTPYGRQRSIDESTIESAYERLSDQEDSVALRRAIKLLFLLDYSVEVESISANMSQGGAMPDPEIADQADRMWQENYEPIINTIGDVLASFTTRPINHDRYLGSQWLETPREVGTIAGRTLFLVGWEEPGREEYALVAAADSGQRGRLWATPLYELLGRSQEPIKITGSLEP